jgi:hypothetical protein
MRRPALLQLLLPPLRCCRLCRLLLLPGLLCSVLLAVLPCALRPLQQLPGSLLLWRCRGGLQG